MKKWIAYLLLFIFSFILFIPVVRIGDDEDEKVEEVKNLDWYFYLFLFQN